LAEAGDLGPGKCLLDLGCGTGRWTFLLVEKTSCDAVGVDSSPEMLEKARAKDEKGRVIWLEGDIYKPPVAPKSFDCALMSLMLHHLEDPHVAFRAAYVSLRPGGVLLLRQGTLEQILNDPVHHFFPRSIMIDLKRTPLRREVEKWLAAAGFEHIAAEPVRMRTRNSPSELLEEVENRVSSVLRLIPEKAFTRELAVLREYIETNPDDPWLVEESMTLFVVRRPE
jgi:ubiquinone/menaquinone biosynthesis C-methylase UbiE